MGYMIVDGKRLLDRCPYCDKLSVAPSTRSKTMCQACYDKLVHYRALKHKLKMHPNNETSEQLAEMMRSYKEDKAKGRRVPRDIV